METYTRERHTILPPQPSFSRRLRAFVSARWCQAVLLARRTLAALAAPAQPIRARRATAPVPEGSGIRLSDVITAHTSRLTNLAGWPARHTAAQMRRNMRSDVPTVVEMKRVG